MALISGGLLLQHPILLAPFLSLPLLTLLVTLFLSADLDPLPISMLYRSRCSADLDALLISMISQLLDSLLITALVRRSSATNASGEKLMKNTRGTRKFFHNQ
jgi:hypothetical protein